MRPLRTQTQTSGQGESATTHPEAFPALPASDVTLSTRESPHPPLLGQLSGCPNSRETGVLFDSFSPTWVPQPQDGVRPSPGGQHGTKLLAPVHHATTANVLEVLEVWALSHPRASQAELWAPSTLTSQSHLDLKTTLYRRTRRVPKL